MHERGGTLTQGGIKYQDAVAALYLARLIDMRPRPDEQRPVKVRVEAPDPVDDIVVEFADGHREYVQVKENLSTSGETWKKLWMHFEEQKNKISFGQGDRIVLILGIQNKRFQDLKSLCNRARIHPDAENWLHSLSNDMLATTDQVRKSWHPESKNDNQLVDLFSSIFVDIIPSDRIETEYWPIWMPVTSIEPRTFFEILLAKIFIGASRRAEFDAPSLLEQIESVDLLKGSLVSAGILELARLMANPDVRKAAAEYRNDFEITSAYLEIIDELKTLHDRFQEVDFPLNTIIRERKHIEPDAETWGAIEENLDILSESINKILDCYEGSSLAEKRALWVNKLTTARGELIEAVDQTDIQKLDRSIRTLRSIVSRRTSWINDRIIYTAEFLQLEKIIAALDTILNRISVIPLDLKAIDTIKMGVNAIGDLDERLADLIKNHNLMQEIDNEMRRMEDDMIGEVYSISMQTYQELELYMNNICDSIKNDNVDELTHYYQQLGEALSGNLELRIKLAFQSFRRRITKCFIKIDDNLLELTKELRVIGDTIKVLLEVYQ